MNTGRCLLMAVLILIGMALLGIVAWLALTPPA
jgi:hypothetical protein